MTAATVDLSNVTAAALLDEFSAASAASEAGIR